MRPGRPPGRPADRRADGHPTVGRTTVLAWPGPAWPSQRRVCCFEARRDQLCTLTLAAAVSLLPTLNPRHPRHQATQRLWKTTVADSPRVYEVPAARAAGSRGPILAAYMPQITSDTESIKKNRKNKKTQNSFKHYGRFFLLVREKFSTALQRRACATLPSSP